MTASSTFVHRFVPGRNPAGPVLLLLHGTGGDESDLIPLGERLLPGAALVSPRGRVLENGMPRFFRRLAEGVFDIPDLMRQTDELASFISTFRRQNDLMRNPMVAVGFSNGANIAASLLLLHPSSVSEAVLFRPMVPFQPEVRADLTGTGVFIGAGEFDPVVPVQNTLELARIFEDAGADVSLNWHRGGHQLGSDEVEPASKWLTSFISSQKVDSVKDGPQ
jgi:phospholipase/carboxylesterase/glyoxalase family protein